jgi:predicted metalloprotease
MGPVRFGPEDDSTENVEDRRGFGGTGLRVGLGGFLILGALSLLFRENLFALLDQGDATDRGGSSGQESGRAAREEPLKAIAVRSFNDAQHFFAKEVGARRAYTDAKLVLFWDQTRSGCGAADAEMGPFYCSADAKVYIDLGFYDELAQRFHSPGEFAQAYVMAHEMGHHAQDILGIEASMRKNQQAEPTRKNELSVRLELQADCFAGAWGHAASERGLLDRGEVEQGLAAAAAIGDDAIQKMAGRAVRPESFTHGSSAMRVHWFRRGLDRGNLDDCDTFSVPSL